jgi:hypothetical protein
MLTNGRSWLYTIIRRTDVKVLGKQALGMFLVGTDQMERVNTSLSTIKNC